LLATLPAGLLAPIHAAVAALTATIATTSALSRRQWRSQRDAKHQCRHPCFHKFTSAVFLYIFITITTHAQSPLIPACSAKPLRSPCAPLSVVRRLCGQFAGHHASSVAISQVHTDDNMRFQ
jgi:hypothetical protein